MISVDVLRSRRSGLWGQNQTETELQMLRSETEQREACSQLRMQISRLEVETASRVAQLYKARQIQAKLEGARDSAQQRGAELAHRGLNDQRQQLQTWKRDSASWFPCHSRPRDR